MKTPEEQLIMNESDKFASLDSIISEENYEEPAEPAVVDSDDKSSKESAEKSAEENLPPAEAEKFTPLSKLKDGNQPETADDNAEEDSEEEPESDVIENDDDKKDNKPAEGLNDVFNFFVENQYLNLPEDFEFDGTEESMQKAFELDQQVRNTMAWNTLENSIQDPMVFKLIEYGINGGSFAEINNLIETTQAAIDVNNMDVTDPDQAEKILTKYYQEVSKFSPDRVKKFVALTKEQDILEEEAKVALDYYKDHYSKEQQRLEQEAKQKKEIAEQSFKEKLSGIQTAAKDLGYSGDVAKNVAMLVAPVIDTENGNKQVYKDNGQPMLWYEVVLDQIQENPLHLTQLLGILQAYNETDGLGKSINQQKKTEQSNKNLKSFDTLNKLKRTKGGGTANPGSGSKYTPPAPDSYDLD